MKIFNAAVLGLAMASLASCASAPKELKMASASMKSRSGSAAEGHVHFHQVGENINVAYEIHGLAPNSAHGFHLHEKGDCSAPDATSAGGHYNPTHMDHGGPQMAVHHEGDLGNIKADAEGTAKGEVTIPKYQVQTIVGTSVVVHGKADDEKSQPAGDSGPRIACGVVEAM